MENEKRCFVCHKIKPLSEFYKCEGMADGHYGKCKECYKKYATKYREENLERIREYDRTRGKTEKRKKHSNIINARRRKIVKGYQAAHNKVIRAVRKGILQRPKYCEYCGRIGRVEAHHEDYSKPLEVIWLCPICHRNYHTGKTPMAKKIQTEIKRRSKPLSDSPF